MEKIMDMFETHEEAQKCITGMAKDRKADFRELLKTLNLTETEALMQKNKEVMEVALFYNEIKFQVEQEGFNFPKLFDTVNVHFDFCETKEKFDQARGDNEIATLNGENFSVITEDVDAESLLEFIDFDPAEDTLQ